MAAKITIHNLGPIKDCTMELDHFTVLTGRQASGKSTIAKAIYYCRSVKDDICDAILKYNHLDNQSELIDKIKFMLYSKFLQMLEDPKDFFLDTTLKCDYSNDTLLEISSRLCNQDGTTRGSIGLSSNIIEYIVSKWNQVNERAVIQAELNSLFNDDYEAVYIPAGRNLISLLSAQLSYILATMDDD